MKKSLFIIAMFLGFVSTIVFAKKSSSYFTSIEIKPISTIVSIVPGATGVGLEGEMALGKDTVMTVYYDNLGYNPDQKTFDNSIKQDTEDGFNLRNYKQASYAAGLRWYTARNDSSWYYGLKGGIRTSSKNYIYKETTLTAKSQDTLVGGEGGYRWKWDNGILIRLGANLLGAMNKSPNIDSTATDSKDTKDKLLDKLNKEDDPSQTQISLGLDFGFGISF